MTDKPRHHEDLERLCDLSYIEGACAADGARRLLTDYAAALAAIHDETLRGRIDEFARFVRRHNQRLARDPSLVFAQAANEPGNTAPAVAAKRLLESGAVRRPLLQWSNRPAHPDPCLLTIFAGRQGVGCCAYSPNGRRIFAELYGRELAMWDAETGKQIRRLSEVMLRNCEWSPDGSHIAGADYRAIHIWDAETLDQKLSIPAPSACFQYSPDGRFLVSAFEEKDLKIWDAETGENLLTLSGHSNPVTGCAWSPDGSRIASVDSSGILVLWRSETGERLRTLQGAARSVSFSPDSRLVISFQPNASKAWDAHSGEEVGVFREPLDRIVNTCAFAPDGSGVVAACGDNTLKIWDADTGKCLRTYRGHTDEITACACAPDGKRIASASRDKTLRVWDVDSEACAQVLAGHDTWVDACAFSPDGRRIVSASHDRTVRLWDAETGRELRIFRGHSEAVVDCAFSPDGKRISSVSRDNSLRLWDAETGEAIFTAVDGIGPPCSCSPDSNWILTSGYESTVQLWDARCGEMVRALRGHSRWVTAAVFSRDGARIATASADSTVKLWDATDFSELRTFSGHSGEVSDCAFSPDNRRLVSAGADGTLRLWDVETASELKILAGKPYQVTSICCSADGRRMALGCSDGILRIRDLADGRDVCRLAAHSFGINACMFSRNGRRILSGSGDGTVKEWDLDTAERLPFPNMEQPASGRCDYSPDGKFVVSAHGNLLDLRDGESGRILRTLCGHSGHVRACVYSPDGSRILSASEDGTLRIWDPEKGRLLRALAFGHRHGIQAGTYSPDGRWVLSAGSDPSLQIWDSDSGEAILRLDGHYATVEGCSYSPDARCILSASADHTLRLWAADSGVELRMMAGHADRIHGCAYAPDGRRVASSSEGGVLKIWDVRTGRALSAGTPGGDPAFTPDGRYIISGASWNDCMLRVHDAASGEMVAALACDAVVFHPAVSGDGCRMAAGSPQGLRIFRLMGLNAGPPIATQVRLFLPEGSYENSLSFRCSWCGRRSAAPPRVLEAITGIARESRISPDAPPTLVLPPEAWDEPRLTDACPRCSRPLKFNPFVVDDAERAGALLETWKRLHTGRTRILHVGMEAAARLKEGPLDRAIVLEKECERFCRDIGDMENLWWSLNSQSEIFRRLGKPDEALAAITEAMRLCEHLGTPEGMAISLANHAILCLDSDQLPKAVQLADQFHAIAAGLTNLGRHKTVLVIAHERIGDAFLGIPDYPRAIETYRKAIWTVENLVLSAKGDANPYIPLLTSKIEYATLIQTDPEAALDRLVVMLDDQADKEQTSWAVAVLARIGAAATGRLIAALADTQRQVGAAVALRKMGECAIDPLIAALASLDENIGIGAKTVLKNIGPPAVKPLIAALANANAQIRRLAATTLGLIGEQEAIEPLIAALRDEEEKVRIHACAGLVIMGSAVVGPLAALLNDNDKTVRELAQAALNNIKRKEQPAD